MSLQITVKSAANLPNLERFGKSDPLAVLTYKGVRRATGHINNNLNPQWNESFEWPLQTAPSHGEVLSIDVYGHEMVGKNRLLGKTTLPMSEIVKKKKTSHDLKLKGEKGEELPSTISLEAVYIAPAGGKKEGKGDDDDDDEDERSGEVGGGSEEEGDGKLTALDPSSVSASSVEGNDLRIGNT